MANSPDFPHPAYAQYVLEPQFNESKAHLFDDMIAANEAHTIMLQETGIIDTSQATELLRALDVVQQMGVDAFSYQPSVEDLFFAVEDKLIEIAGPEIGGNLQIARSRNDLAAGMNRMVMRRRLHIAIQQVLALRSALITQAEQHTESIMPGITHTQPAQPTTLAHYLLGVIGPLERDFERMQQAMANINQSSFGVAAFTTSSFPIDRERVAELLAFPRYLENGYDAVGAGDHIVQTAQTLVNSVASLSRFVYDLLVWSRLSENLLKIDDAFIQISSIMPQKRNPVVLEHIRIRMGWVYGEANAVQTIIHNAAFGDTNDVEDPMFISLHRCFDAYESVTALLTAVMQTATFNTALMAERAGEGFTTATALADALVREFRVPFRSAHSIVSTLVNQSLETGRPMDAAMVREASAAVLGSALDADDAFVQRSLDAKAFVMARTIPGGCAPETTRAALAECRSRLDTDEEWIETMRLEIDTANTTRDHAIARIKGEMDEE